MYHKRDQPDKTFMQEKRPACLKRDMCKVLYTQGNLRVAVVFETIVETRVCARVDICCARHALVGSWYKYVCMYILY